ncbi:hypothetical protein R3P38DRAFT_2957042 [Favolaschia claudopus]|uniref:Uncharacterized protein n=1 Tax=Favolaschia claudopus TaxID=2862362 RepID=A0AAW0BB17_9AGAR
MAGVALHVLRPPSSLSNSQSRPGTINMAFPCNCTYHRQNSWSKPSLNGLKRLKVENSGAESLLVPTTPAELPPYFWGQGLRYRLARIFRLKLRHGTPHTGYCEARNLIRDGAVADIVALAREAAEVVDHVFRDVGGVDIPGCSVRSKDGYSSLSSSITPGLVQLRLSPGLERWKEDQQLAGKVLPTKGSGLTQASPSILDMFGAGDWPEAMKTNNTFFGCGIASLLIGAADPATLFSNYVTDMVFYYEHGYNHVFPELEPLIERGLTDRHAKRTPGGLERRSAVLVGKGYVQSKIALEKKHKSHLKNQSARFDRRTAQIVFFADSSLLGMAAESVARGFDPAAVMSDLVFSSPGTDVVDVGRDLVNSEVMNSFLNVADVTDNGVVSEDVLRRVYDAYAATGARMLTERWQEPVARMCAALYTWHIQNDRHFFFRSAILGWPKARKTPARPQREADFDEVFDSEYHTTGFSRPLDAKYTCDGKDTCDHVRRLLSRNPQPLLKELWQYLVTLPLEYVRGGKIDEERERDLAEGSRLRMARALSQGMVLEVVWIVAHANHHAWQVNYLFEAAMFGSILDGGKLAGKLDRVEEI